MDKRSEASAVIRPGAVIREVDKYGCANANYDVLAISGDGKTLFVRRQDTGIFGGAKKIREIPAECVQPDGVISWEGR